MPELTQKFTPSRDLVATTPGAPSTAGGFMQGLDPALLARLLQAKLAKNAVPVASYAPEPVAQRGAARRQAVPRLRAEEPFMEAPPLPKTQKRVGRYSYGFTSQLPGGAGTAPHLPTWIGDGREGVDFILEGGPQNWTGGSPRPIANTGDGRMESQKETSMTDAELEARRQPQQQRAPQRRGF